MAKRFINDKIWSDGWFQELDPLYKLLWIYLFSVCDMVGIWEYNEKRAEFDIGKKLPWDKIQISFDQKIIFTTKYWILKSFIKQQYPKLRDKPKAPLHIAVINHINKMCLNFDLNSLSIDYDNPIDSLQVKEKVKEEVKVEEEEKEKKKKYGEYNHVLLTDKQIEKLKVDYGEPKALEMIKKLDEGIQMKGYKYTDHNLAMRTWERTDKATQTSFIPEFQKKAKGKYGDY